MPSPAAGRWQSFWDREVTPADWRLGTWVALLAQLPLLVVFLVLAHAIGRGLYGLFKAGALLGPLTDVGPLSLRWAAYLIGVAVVAAVGLAATAVGVAAQGARPAVRQLLILCGLLLVLGQLVLIPFVAVGHESLWSVIYDFSTLPGLSWAAAVAHGFLLLELWRWWTRRVRWTARAIQHGFEERHQELGSDLHSDPDDVDARLRLADLCTDLGDLRRAGRLLDGAPRDGVDVQLARSRLAIRRRRWKEALAATGAGLASPQLEDGARQRLTANRALALAYLGRPAEAAAAFDDLTPPLADHPPMRFEAALARLAAGDAAGGQADLRALADDLPVGDPLHRHIELRLRGRHRPALERIGIVLQRLWPPVIPEAGAKPPGGLPREEAPTSSS